MEKLKVLINNVIVIIRENVWYVEWTTQLSVTVMN